MSGECTKYDLIPVFLFSFSANIDSFIIGISYGLQKTEIRSSQNLIIALITLCGTIAALLSGSGILKFCMFPFADSIGSLILLILGMYYLLKFCHSLKERCHSVSTHNSSDEICCCTSQSAHNSGSSFPAVSTLSWKEAMLLGVSLSANNLGIGIGASIAGLHVLPTAPISFVLSILFLYLGNLAGKSQLLQKAGQYADVFCGLLLIILGICQ